MAQESGVHSCTHAVKRPHNLGTRNNNSWISTGNVLRFLYFLTVTVTKSISRRCVTGIKFARHAQLQIDLDLQAIASSLREADKS